MIGIGGIKYKIGRVGRLIAHYRMKLLEGRGD